MSESKQELSKAWARAVAKAWADEEYKRRLLTDPQAVAAEEGVPLPEGLTLKVVENTASTMHLVLPAHPNASVGIVGGDVRISAADRTALDEALEFFGYFFCWNQCW